MLMKDLKLDVAAGNFLANITLDIPDEVADNPAMKFFVKEGATRFFQNGVLPGWEKAEASRLKLWPDNDKGIPTRPKSGYKRENIPFSKEGAEDLFKRISDAKIPGKVDPAVTDVNVNENSDYTGTISFLEQWLATPNKKDGSARTVEQFAGKIGVPVPSEPWQEENGFLAQVKTWLAEQD